MTVQPARSPSSLAEYCEAVRSQSPILTGAERAALRRLLDLGSPAVHARTRATLARLIEPIDAISGAWGRPLGRQSRNLILFETDRLATACWGWNFDTWTRFVLDATDGDRHRAHLLAAGYLLGGHQWLHHAVAIPKLGPLADFVFEPGAVAPAVEEVMGMLDRWEAAPKAHPDMVRAALLDALLSAGSPRLEDITLELLEHLVDDNPSSPSRRRGFFKISRVLAANGCIPAPLTVNHQQRGPQASTLATVPDEWAAYVTRFR